MRFNKVEVKHKVLNIRLDPVNPDDMRVVNALQEIISNQGTPEKEHEEGYSFIVKMLSEFYELR